MSGMAALMVLVACPVGSGHCISEPVRVVSYQTASDCQTQMASEIKRSTVKGVKIYGSCNTFDAELLKGRPRIDIALDVKALKSHPVAKGRTETAVGFAPRQ